jgi:alkylated DNA nucleotide flippase Atl1
LALSYLESFLVRRMIASVPTHNLNRIFMRLAPLLDRDERVQDTIREELSSPQRYWVDDAELREAIKSKPFYITGRGQQKKLVLSRLEKAFGGKEKVDLDGTTIEHVLPQHLTVEWRRQLSEEGENPRELHASLVHTLGNLTLTGYNSELGDLPYEEKRERLLQTSIQLTKSITEHRSWGRAEILSRADLLTDKAIGIWPGPLERPEDKSQGKDWTLLHDAVALLEPGSWTSYNDLAQLVGTAPLPVGVYLASSGPLGAHRVLTSGGQISPGFRWADPEDDRDVRAVLIDEGLKFDEKGQADPSLRLSAVELAQRLDLPGAEDFAEPEPIHVDPSQLEKFELRFHRQLAARSGPVISGAVSGLLDHWSDRGHKLTFGTAPTLGRCTPVIKRKGVEYWLFNIYPEQIDVAFNALAKRAPFDDLELREEIRQRLNTAPGIDLPASKIGLFPSFSCAVLTNPSAWDVVIATLDWFAHRVSLIE